MKYITITVIFILGITVNYGQEKEHTVTVQGLCGMCEERIIDAAEEAGAIKTTWDAESLLLKVTFDAKKTSIDKIQQNVALKGHDTGKYKATDEVYNELPGCCQYRGDVSDYSHPLRGRVLDADGIPLAGAMLSWEGTTEGVLTDSEGGFTLAQKEEHNLIVDYIGYPRDIIDIGNGKGFLTITMGEGFLLSEVEVVHKRRSTSFSFSSPIKTEIIGEKELERAACCNLSQSFETTPVIDVSFSDAVTGVRQIQLLGLSGKYVQISSENIPDVRGLDVINGLSYIPGTWIESIQLSKGGGSVATGYEGITGQINVEMKKTDRGEKLLANLYGNSMGVLESNLNLRQPLSEKWSTALFLHTSTNNNFQDKNRDTFADIPLGETIIFSNRWKRQGDSNWGQRFGVKILQKNSKGGQLAIEKNPWRLDSHLKKYSAYVKTGKIFELPATSLGFQLSGDVYEQNEMFGKRIYSGRQKSAYFSTIFQSYISNTMHQYRAGVNLQYDSYDEELERREYDRTERVAGAFFEYTYQPSEKITMVGGIRADYHNTYKAFYTPRFHFKYQPYPKTSLRLSAAKGYRTANILSEYKSVLASSKKIKINSQNHITPYGLEQEKAWNYGFSFSQKLDVFSREAVLSIDAYRTDFSNQIIADYNKELQAIHFYNLNGDSYANSLQLQVDYELVDRLEMRLAYKYQDVKATYSNKLQTKPFISKHRGFVNLNYTTPNGWATNLTTSWQSSKHLPSLQANPTQYQRRGTSPYFSLTNFQLSKTWESRWDVYIGVENLFDYVQENPIISAQNPYGEYFDSSRIWGSIHGREIYVGLRFRILE